MVGPMQQPKRTTMAGSGWGPVPFTQVVAAAVSHLGRPVLAGSPYVLAEALVAAGVGLVAWVTRARQAAAPG